MIKQVGHQPAAVLPQQLYLLQADASLSSAHQVHILAFLACPG